jgi:hypothetical protein
MKNAILFLLIFTAATAQGQTLKDLLFSGKMKSDTGTLVRKTDDLKSKIDTAQKKPVEQAKPIAAVSTTTATANQTTTAPVKTEATVAKEASATSTEAVAVENKLIGTEGQEASAPVETKTPVKSNTKIWKEYSEALVADLKDILANKKVKKESYYFTVEYKFTEDGKTDIVNVTADPNNDVLVANVRQKISDNPPALTPVLDSKGKPLKSVRRYSFNITKE